MKLRHRCLVSLFRHSWRAYSHANAILVADGLRIPIVGAVGLGNLTWRSLQFQTVLKAALAIRPHAHIIDIGANVGQFLLNLIYLDRSNPYLAFEPLLASAAYIRRLIVENALAYHNILPVALADRCGTGTIRFGCESDASATLSDSMRPPSMYLYHQRVAISTADLQLTDIQSIALVKIDVEGTELSVLRGMSVTLARHRPPILIEVMPYAHLLDGSYDRGYFGDLSEVEAKRIGAARRENCIALETFLQDYDYRFFACTHHGCISGVATLDRGPSMATDTDFLLVPSESAGAFADEIVCGVRRD